MNPMNLLSLLSDGAKTFDQLAESIPPAQLDIQLLNAQKAGKVIKQVNGHVVFALHEQPKDGPWKPYKPNPRKERSPDAKKLTCKECKKTKFEDQFAVRAHWEGRKPVCYWCTYLKRKAARELLKLPNRETA